MSRRIVAVLAGLSLASTAFAAEETKPAYETQIHAPQEKSAVRKELVQVTPGGLTADQAAARAIESSLAVQQQQQAVAEAAARVDEAFYSFFPRISTNARYTRLSSLTPPALGGGSLVATTAPPGTPNPTPTVAFALSFPVFLNQASIGAGIAIPLSDYALRISKANEAASNARAAAQLNELAAKAKAQSDARIGFYNWLRTLGAVTVTEQTLADRRTHLADAKLLFAAGTVSNVDVLRAEADVTGGEQQLARARSLSRLAERSLKLLLQLPSEDRLAPGEPLTAPVQPAVGEVRTFTQRARDSRPELKSIDETLKALAQQKAITRAGNYPSLYANADALLANPNPRVQPATKQEWVPTWSAGLLLTWSPNDLLVSNQQIHGQQARIAQLESQRAQLADGLDLETTSAFEDLSQAQFAIDASTKQLGAAEEAFRVTQVLYREGRALQTTLEDVETQVTLARLSLLNAHADLHVARVKLDHATGDDTLQIKR